MNKKIVVIGTVLSILMVGWISKVSASTLQTIEIPVRSVLAPAVGFDDNDNVQVVLYGELPNSCFEVGDYSIEKLPDGRSMRIHQFAVRKADVICGADQTLPPHMNMIVPFTTEISLGQLPYGDYQFEYSLYGGGTASRSLNVAKANMPSIDSLPYAAVSNALTSDVVGAGSDVKVILSGILNSTCTELDDNIQLQRVNDVYVILPTIKVTPGVVCAQAIRPFQKEINLGKTGVGHHLIHIRSMNGKAINRVFETVN